MDVNRLLKAILPALLLLVLAASHAFSKPIHEACENGSIQVIKKLLQKGANVDVRDKYGKTGLMIAAGRGYDEVLQLLLKSKANAGIQDKNGCTALIWAAAGSGKGSSVRLLLPQSKIDATDRSGRSALAWAAIKSNLEALQALLDAGADINLADKKGETPLIKAAIRGNKGAVKILLDAGANAALTDKSAKTALDWATSKRYKETAKLLKAAERTGFHRHQAIKVACIALALLALLFLLLCFALPKAPRRKLLDAVKKGMGGEVKRLLATRPNLDATDKLGRSALIIAAHEGFAEIVRLLLDAGAGVEQKDKEGKSALMHAVEGRHAQIVRTLLAAGADANSKARGNRTPLMEAAKAGDAEIVRMLLGAGADAGSTDDFGNTALDCAAGMERGKGSTRQPLGIEGAGKEGGGDWKALLGRIGYGRMECVREIAGAMGEASKNNGALTPLALRGSRAKRSWDKRISVLGESRFSRSARRIKEKAGKACMRLAKSAQEKLEKYLKGPSSPSGHDSKASEAQPSPSAACARNGDVEAGISDTLAARTSGNAPSQPRLGGNNEPQEAPKAATPAAEQNVPAAGGTSGQREGTATPLQQSGIVLNRRTALIAGIVCAAVLLAGAAGYFWGVSNAKKALDRQEKELQEPRKNPDGVLRRQEGEDGNQGRREQEMLEEVIEESKKL